jgi:hypothetical protein
MGGADNLPLARIHWTKTCRLVPSRHPSVGLFDRVASTDDIDAIIELEGWTNDRLSGELGILANIPRDEWVVGRPMASVIMAPFCHLSAGGGRFSLAESIYHRTSELTEIGAYETRVEVRLYHADFRTRFHDVRAPGRTYAPLHDPDDYEPSQKLGRRIFEEGGNGFVYRSVRNPGGECVACYRPRLVLNVRAAAHYEYRWDGSPAPRVRRLA